ncbi:MAG TPA: sulfocyanin-like copper-binding protein [Gemmatimonadales bacterium]|nr:sulfocyanin-like copper-binding protein [Gemmatimonadales bacterium]
MRIWITGRHHAVILAGAIVGLAAAGCSKRDDGGARVNHAGMTGGSTAAAPSSGNSSSATTNVPANAPDGSAKQDQTPKYDAASNTVTFDLIGGPSGFKFNGYANGDATLTVPAKANVVMNFVNEDGTPHSAEIYRGDGPLPNVGGTPAIPRAYTNKVVEGLPQGGKDVMRFTAPEQGNYRIICGVPGHALSGMWIWFKVDPAAKTPSFGPTKK